MSKKRIFIIVNFLLINSTFDTVNAQSSIDNTRANEALRQAASNGLGPGGSIYQFSSPDDRMKVLGDTYYDSRWSVSSVLLTDNKKIEGYFGRYDLRQNEFEIASEKGLKVVSAGMIKSVEWIDSLSKEKRRFINIADYGSGEIKFTGLAELLNDGKIPLLKRILLDEIPPTFNAATNSGSKDLMIIKKTKFFFVVDKNVIELKKKQVFKAFPNSKQEIDSFCKRESINWAKEDDLKKLFVLLNSKFQQ